MLKNKKAGCSSYASVSDDYILYNKATKPVSGGGRKNKKGGDFMSSLPKAFDDVTKALTTPPKTGGNGGCSSCGSRGGSRGGAVELAPFAASLAFLATRMAVDKELNFKKLWGKVSSSTGKSSSVRKTPSTRKSSTVRKTASKRKSV